MVLALLKGCPIEAADRQTGDHVESYRGCTAGCAWCGYLGWLPIEQWRP